MQIWCHFQQDQQPCAVVKHAERRFSVIKAGDDGNCFMSLAEFPSSVEARRACMVRGITYRRNPHFIYSGGDFLKQNLLFEG